MRALSSPPMNGALRNLSNVDAASTSDPVGERRTEPPADKGGPTGASDKQALQARHLSSLPGRIARGIQVTLNPKSLARLDKMREEVKREFGDRIDTAWTRTRETDFINFADKRLKSSSGEKPTIDQVVSDYKNLAREKGFHPFEGNLEMSLRLLTSLDGRSEPSRLLEVAQSYLKKGLSYSEIASSFRMFGVMTSQKDLEMIMKQHFKLKDLDIELAPRAYRLSESVQPSKNALINQQYFVKIATLLKGDGVDKDANLFDIYNSVSRLSKAGLLYRREENPGLLREPSEEVNILAKISKSGQKGNDLANVRAQLSNKRATYKTDKDLVTVHVESADTDVT